MWNPSVFGEHLNKGLELNFWPILKVKLCFVLDKFSVFVNIRRRQCHTGWAKKLSFKLLFIYMYSPKSDGFYIFYISKWGVAACLVITLLQIFHIMRQWKKFWEWSLFDKDMDKSMWLTFWATLYLHAYVCSHKFTMPYTQHCARYVTTCLYLTLFWPFYAQ